MIRSVRFRATSTIKMSATVTTTTLKIRLSFPGLDGKVTTTLLSYHGQSSLSALKKRKRGPPGDIEAPREMKKLKMEPKVKPSSKVDSGLCGNIKKTNATGLNSHKPTLPPRNVSVTQSREDVGTASDGLVELTKTVKHSTPPPFSVPLSPTKALHAARHRLQFAHTFVKSQQNGKRIDPLKFQQDKAIFEREQREEIARLEAILREKDRQEARIALEEVERTVVFEDNCYILKELKQLSGYYDRRCWGSHFRSPLERLGLFLKDDTLEVDELEEGEIV